MKIKKLAIIILTITLFIILGNKVEATTGKINSETVRIRKQPSTESTIIDQLDKGDKVEILEQKNGWYKIKATTDIGTITGYIKEGLIDAEDTNVEAPTEKEEPKVETTVEAPEATETVSPDVNVETPDTNTINTVEENEQYVLQQEIVVKVLPLINSREKAELTGNIKVIEIINDWVKVESDTESGWIRKNTLKNSLIKAEDTAQEPEKEEQPSTQPEESKTEETKPEEPTETELNKVGYVSTEGLRVRKGPSTDTEEITSLSKNDEVKIIGQSGKWYKINLKGEIGYVSAKYISDTKVPETTSRSGSTLKNETITKTEEKTEEPKVEETPNVQEPVQSTTGDAIVEYAKQYLGYKYVSGGTSPSKGFDCSGFTQYVYKHFGISLYRTSKDQIKNGVAVSKDNLQPGDLVIFNNDANTAIGHVGIYVGDGNFIHASNPSDGVKITTLKTGYYKTRYVGARRVF